MSTDQPVINSTWANVSTDMMTTETPRATDEEVMWALLKYQLYIWEGGLIAVTNGLMLAAICFHSVLRKKKEYIIAGSLAFADMFSGLGYFSAGIYRSYLHYNYLDAVKVTPKDCLLTLHNILWLPSEAQSGVVLTQVTLDRLLAVVVPMQYFGYAAPYAWKLTLIFYAYDVAFTAAGLAISLMETTDTSRIYNKVCFSGDMFGENRFFRQYYFYARMGGGFISVILYFIVLMRARALLGKVAAKSDKELSRRMEKQRKLNMTVGISTFFTFFLFCIPNTAWSYLESDPKMAAQLASLGPVIMSVSNLNPMLNFFIYSLRHKDLKVAVKMMFKGEKLTKAKLDKILSE